MSRFQTILALDSAMGGVCAGVYAGGRRYAYVEVMNGGQGERLLPVIQDVMAEAGIDFPALDAVVTTVGPGAFTGLRIGLSAAKSLGLALGRPVFGITTLQALASQYAQERKPEHSFGVIIESKREDFYFQKFAADGTAVSEAAALSAPDILGQLKDGEIVLGDGAGRFRAALPGSVKLVFEADYTLPDAGFMALNLQENLPLYVLSPAPLYLRGPDVTASKKPARPLISSR